jgi:alpha-1,6-mannosyltransferase
MKSVHLTSAWHPQSGGVRTFYLAMLEAAEALGHEMRLIVPGGRDAVEQVGKYGRIYQVRAPRALIAGPYRVLLPWAYLPGGRIHRILRQEQPDLIEVCDKLTLPYLGGLLRVGAMPGIGFRPIVVCLSCERFDDTIAAYIGPGKALRFLARLYLRWAYFPLADQHIAVSDYVAEELRAVADGHKVQRGVWRGPMGVDYRTFASARRDAATREWLEQITGATPNSTLVVYAGRLAPEKNVSVLIDGFKILSRRVDADYRLLIAGSGPYRQKLEEEARQKAPGRIAFLGHVSPASNLARIFANCDLFVHANGREPFGIGPLEAMAAGLPVVVPNQGGVLMYANAENACLCEPVAEGFAGAIVASAEDPAATARRAAAAKKTAESMQWSVAAGHFVQLYQALVTRTAGRPCNTGPAPLFLSSFQRNARL